MESAVDTDQPTGQAHQIPMDPITLENAMASTTRNARSTEVAAINFFMSPAPLSTPSATSLAEITK